MFDVHTYNSLNCFSFTVSSDDILIKETYDTNIKLVANFFVKESNGAINK